MKPYQSATQTSPSSSFQAFLTEVSEKDVDFSDMNIPLTRHKSGFFRALMCLLGCLLCLAYRYNVCNVAHIIQDIKHIRLTSKAAVGKSMEHAENQPQTSHVQQQLHKIHQEQERLDHQKKLLSITLVEMDKKITEIKALQKSLKNTLTENEATEKNKIQQFIKVVEGMKAKNAAQIMESMNMNVLKNFLPHMNPKKLSPILDQMNPVKARSILVLTMGDADTQKSKTHS